MLMQIMSLVSHFERDCSTSLTALALSYFPCSSLQGLSQFFKTKTSARKCVLTERGLRYLFPHRPPPEGQHCRLDAWWLLPVTWPSGNVWTIFQLIPVPGPAPPAGEHAGPEHTWAPFSSEVHSLPLRESPHPHPTSTGHSVCPL